MSEQANISAWLRERALPLWTSVGFDARTGLFAERLDAGGSPRLGLPRRAMVQARQIFVACTAERYGWLPDAGDIALRAGDALLRHYAAEDGGWIFSIDPERRPLDRRRDLYCQAFCLFALAALTRLDRGGPWLAHAERTLDFLDTAMRATGGGFAECLPASPEPRRQNPHMHLLEALHALHEAAPDERLVERADEIVRLLEDRFLQRPGPALCEYFDACLDPLDAHQSTFEPGHHFEWAWLLARHAKLTGTPVSPSARQLWEAAVTHGIGSDGAVFDEVAVDGAIVGGGTRLWPHAEGIKAAACGIAGDEPSPSAEDLSATLHTRFLAPAHPGAWIDHFDASGRATSTEAPASSLYHICSAAAVLEEAKKSPRRGSAEARPLQH